MSDIKMVDLAGQYQKIEAEIDQAIKEVILSSAFINGPEVKKFAQELSEYQGTKHVIPCGNGTDALQIALMALELKPGDEIIVPDFTFIATAEVVALLGLKPIFVDVCKEYFTLDIDSVTKAITPRTKAIVPVHLYGQCAPMEEIMELAKQHSLFVIEDNAQAIGSEVFIDGTWKHAGTVGHIGCYSFFPSKNLGCYGDGGAISTNDPDLAEKIRCIANHGSKVKYYNSAVGVNSRLDTIQAAILRIKLKHIKAYTQARQAAAKLYRKNLANIPQVKLPELANYSKHVYHQFTIQVDQRDQLKSHLAEQGIPSMVYYPLAMHQQEAYAVDGNFGNSAALCQTVLSLPMHTELNEMQIEFICTQIQVFYNN